MFNHKHRWADVWHYNVHPYHLLKDTEWRTCKRSTCPAIQSFNPNTGETHVFTPEESSDG